MKNLSLWDRYIFSNLPYQEPIILTSSIVLNGSKLAIVIVTGYFAPQYENSN